MNEAMVLCRNMYSPKFCFCFVVFVFKAPGPFTGEYNAFVMERVFHGANDETTCLDWSSDSTILAVGSKDMTTKLYCMDKYVQILSKLFMLNFL